MWDWILFILVAIFLLVALYFQIIRLQKLSSKNKSEAGKYGKNVLAGLVSGVSVVILDRGMNLAFKNSPAIDYTSWITIFKTGSAGFIVLLIEASLILLLIFWVINNGLTKIVKSKPIKKKLLKK